MRKIFLISFFASISSGSFGQVAYPVSHATIEKEIKQQEINSQIAQQSPYVVLVSLDGYRYDYSEKFNASFLKKFEVRTERMLPSFPSKTFPNHYTLVTGLYPGHHGIVSNKFYSRRKKEMYDTGNRKAVEDGSWYGGTPLWVLAGEQEMVSASMFWIGSEADIKHRYPTYHFKYDGSISNQERVNIVANWLLLPPANRPHFITLYFSDVDSQGHEFGPDSKQVAAAVDEMDHLLEDLWNKILATRLVVNLIVVSDHGMMQYEQTKSVSLKETIIPDSTIISISMPAMLYNEDKEVLSGIKKSLTGSSQVDVFWMNELPEHYHYDDYDRIGDLVIMPKPAFRITYMADVLPQGASTHGYDPSVCKEMGAIFYAMGPAFRAVGNIKPFENIHVFPLIAEILGLNYSPDSIDGNLQVLSSLLRKKETPKQ